MMNHIYIDRRTGAIGYQGDLKVTAEAEYTDASGVAFLASSKKVPLGVTGNVNDLAFAKLGSHEFEWLERVAPERRIAWLGGDGFGHVCSTPTTKSRPAVA